MASKIEYKISIVIDQGLVKDRNDAIAEIGKIIQGMNEDSLYSNCFHHKTIPIIVSGKEAGCLVFELTRSKGNI